MCVFLLFPRGLQTGTCLKDDENRRASRAGHEGAGCPRGGEKSWVPITMSLGQKLGSVSHCYSTEKSGEKL